MLAPFHFEVSPLPIDELPRRRPRGTLRHEWTQIRYTLGRVLYYSRASEALALNVWRPRGTWNWAVVLRHVTSPEQDLVLDHGTAHTMFDAKVVAELRAERLGILPRQLPLPISEGQLELPMKDAPSDLPF